MIHNKIKTAVLLSLLTGILLFLGSLIGGSTGALFSLALAACLNFLLYFYSDKLALSLYNAKELDKTVYASVYQDIQGLAYRMKLPMPKLWLIDMPAPNAFATGRSPAHASVAFTKSIIQMLTPEELRAVSAHELSHVKNRDVLIATIAATVAGAISYMCSFIRSPIFLQRSGSSSKNGKRENLFGLFIMAILMPLVTLIIQLAITRSREYLADETGACACGEPLALARALEKIHESSALERTLEKIRASSGSSAQASPMQEQMAALFIVNPLTSSSIVELFSTHPPVEKRVERLKKIAENLTLYKRKRYDY
jgi:heat shock protein HtpX